MATLNRQPRQRTPRQLMLAAVAQETLKLLPDILADVPALKPEASIMYNFGDLSMVNQSTCPKLPKATIKVVNEDSFNAAIDISARDPQAGKIAVLNLASHKNPGGGWLNGATAQEEALCYRSSLALSLHKRYYPWRRAQGLYTGDVIVIRSAMDNGHKLLWPTVKPSDLPVFSVISVAAVCRPELKATNVIEGGKVVRKEKLANATDRQLTIDKMRLTLRIAAANGHTSLVLGALGCGAFKNPPEEIAQCWLEVLQEPEFAGGLWREICFAVYDRRNEGNFDIFEKTLGGKQV